MREIAYAKINLALHVRQLMENGYHELETVFAFVDAGDVITVSENEIGAGTALSISGPFAADLSRTENLVLDAAQLLSDHAERTADVKLSLNKILPIASGIGGGSADAAATLRLLNRYWELNIPLSELAKIAEPLGADVPACVLCKTSSGQGIGHKLAPLVNGELMDAGVLLVNPLKPVSTAQVFAKWGGQDKGKLDLSSPLNALTNGRNDLENAAVKSVPEISIILQSLFNTGPIAAKMSGSGATCFAIYNDHVAAKAAERQIAARHPAFWTMTGSLL